MKTREVTQSDNSIDIICEDETCNITICYHFEMHAATDVVRIQTTVENVGNAPLTVDWAAVTCLPLSRELEDFISFSGRWAGEFATERHSVPQGGFIVENRRGAYIP